MAVVPMRKKGQAAESTAVAKPYEPTAQELSSQAAYRKRRDARKPAPGMKVTMSTRDGKAHAALIVDHPDAEMGYELVANAIGSESGDFLRGSIDALAMAAQRGTVVDEGLLNYGLSIVQGIRPKDQLEATLAVQMAAVHLAAMNTAASFGGSATLQVKEMHERALNRLTRTFAAQIETLKRYRSKGKQWVYVERVNVEKGGQAIVGNVGRGGEEQDENG